MTTLTPAELTELIEGRHHDPHSVLGAHETDAGAVVRVRRPEAIAVSMTIDGDRPRGQAPRRRRVRDRGAGGAPPSTSRCRSPTTIVTVDLHDPYRFWPTLGEVDLHLIGEGRHERLWDVLGARPQTHQGVDGTAFAVWAPNARAVRVVGDWNSWDGRLHPMRTLGSSGVWELFVPEAEVGHRYRFEIVGADGALRAQGRPHGQRHRDAAGQRQRHHRRRRTSGTTTTG